MKKWFIIFLILFLIPFVFASNEEFTNQIKKITFYSQEYESGNINYPQFIVYSNEIIRKLDQAIGEAYINGTSEQEILKNALGESTQITRKVWSNDGPEKRLDSPLPIWRKIIFDGQKIQIIFSADPHYDSYSKKIIYSPNLQVKFKSAKINLDINNKFDEITSLANEAYTSNDKDKIEQLAVTTSDIEKNFRDYYDDNQGDCEDLMKGIFGSENEGEVQNIIVNSYEIESNEDGTLNAQFERCDECESPFLMFNLNLNIDQEIKFKEENFNKNKDFVTDKKDSEIEEEIKKNIEEAKKAFLEKDYEKVMKLSSNLKYFSELLRMKYVDFKFFNEENKKKSEEILQQQNVPRDFYYGIKQGLLMRQLQKDYVKNGYANIKEFYINYLSTYKSQEYTYTQINFKKVLFKSLKSIGNEVCDNNVDDNTDGDIDCSDSSCSGKICGTEVDNSTSINLYCIENTCQAKKELTNDNVCGNGICEPNERGSCELDCNICTSYPAINCSGKVIFSGYDSNLCPFNPICIEENKKCTINSDCIQPLCGIATCIDNECKVENLSECKEAECIEGDEKSINCGNNKLVIEKCLDSKWIKTGLTCEENEQEENKILNNESNTISGNECIIKEDCNDPNYICSNGKCIIIPINSADQIEEEIETPIVEEINKNTNEEENIINETKISGNFILNFIQPILKITGYSIDEPEVSNEDNQEKESENTGNNENNQNSNQELNSDNLNENSNQETNENLERQRNEDEIKKDEENRRKQQENERKMNDCKARCSGECENEVIVNPCVNPCVFKDDGKTGDLDKCKKECSEKNKDKLSQCNEECTDKCKKGDLMNNEKMQNKNEKNSFIVSGFCRISNSKSMDDKNGNFAELRFNFEGNGFEEFRNKKDKLNNFDGGVLWHGREYKQLYEERKELEKGFNQDFAIWFFENYLPNIANGWDFASDGINQIYNIDQKNIMEMSRHLSGLSLDTFPEYNLINISYKTEYGELEFWENLETANLKNVNKFMSKEDKNKDMILVTPYMKMWVFPKKDFLKNQLISIMNNKMSIIPGAAKDRNVNGISGSLSPEDKQNIMSDNDFMRTIQSISKKYGGEMNGAIQLQDNNEIIFNTLLKVNQEDIVKIKPMPVSELNKTDIKLILDFNKVYDFAYTINKEIDANQVYMPEWKKSGNFKGSVSEVLNGMKLFVRVNDIIGSAKIEPRSARNDVNKLTKAFIDMIIFSSKNNEESSNNLKSEDNKKEVKN